MNTPEGHAVGGWFEERYRTAAAGGPEPSWVDRRPNPNLLDWLAGSGLKRGRALVVGCGLGDDAAALLATGFSVTAFDVAPTAVRVAATRFADLSVTWRTADLLDLPGEWRGSFDLVVEIYTIQVMPMALRQQALAALTTLVAPDGMLFLLCRGRNDADPLPINPPWPLTATELVTVDRTGLRRTSFVDFADPHENAHPRRFRATWLRV